MLKFKFVFRDNYILKIKITRYINKRARYITICDSYAILSNSLDTLCKHYNVSDSKGVFPYTYANEKTLFYIGEAPSTIIIKNI